jgi:hypothetical protein
MTEALTALILEAVLGLYPREWRARYGGEVRDLVRSMNEEHARSVFGMLPSLIAGATVEWMHSLRRINGAGMAAAVATTIVVAAASMTLAQRTTGKVEHRTVVVLQHQPRSAVARDQSLR